MRSWSTGFVFGIAALSLAAPAVAARSADSVVGVTVHRGGGFGDFNALRRFPGADLRGLPTGRFEGFCCVAYPGAGGDTPGIIVINAAPPPPPPARPAAPAARFTVETTPSGVTIVRGPPILP